MKYRIIEESNKAGDTYFEAFLYKKQWYGLYRWEPIRTYRMDFEVTRSYTTRDEAFEALKKRCWTRKTVEQGTL